MKLIHELAAAFLCAVLLWSGSAAAATTDEQRLDQAFARSTLKIATADAQLHKIDIWIADNDARRSRGLMFVEHMADDAGMLFIYPGEQAVSFWMKNTLIPLDMLFVKADGSIAHIAHNAVPMDETPIDSGASVKAVLEINGGTANALGIKEGDKVEYQTRPAQ